MTQHLDDHDTAREARLRLVLTSWQFWVGIAYFGLVAVVIAIVIQNGSISKAETLRVTLVQSNAAATYAACTTAIPTLKRANHFVVGVKELGDTLIANAELMHDVTDPNSPAYAVQALNLQRLRHSRALIAGLHFPAYTLKQCVAQRDAILTSGGIKPPSVPLPPGPATTITVPAS